ncbi:MAG: HNH endonuclease [Deltaproteobacteria bacterium]|nr:MAG: HNH endonuclease [Deltaproteobacteria bacterium]
MDHIVPASKGGCECDENIVACCPDCNRKKGDSMP